MASHPPLFTIPIAPTPPSHPGGSITCTEPQPGVYLLTFVSPPDNRMTSSFCRAMLTALDVLEFGPHKPGVVLTTSGIPKFYSNGLDLEHAIATEGFWPLLYSLWKRFLTYPMPTLALLNGHTFAGGLMMATCHDYRLAPNPKGYLCLNELIFGAPLKPQMAAIFRTKLQPLPFRSLVLEAHRFTGAEAVTYGLADGTCGPDDVVGDGLKFVKERALLEKPKSGVYGVLKKEMYKDLVDMMDGEGMEREEKRFEGESEREGERKEFGNVWFEQWEKEQKHKSKAKL